MNHRLGKRIDASRDVMLNVAGLGKVEGRLENISLSGAAVICKDVYLLEHYMPLCLYFELTDGHEPDQVAVDGFVVRIDGPLIGIMFMSEIVELLKRMNSTRQNTYMDDERLVLGVSS
jgi:hypothetical protein